MSQCHCIYVDSWCHLKSHVTVSLYIRWLVLSPAESCYNVTVYALVRAVSCRVMSQCHCIYVGSCCLLQSHVKVSLYIRWFVLSPAESCHSVTVYTLIRAVFCRVMLQCHCIYVGSCCLLQSHVTVSLYIRWFVLSPAESCQSVTVYTLVRAVSCRVVSLYIPWFVLSPGESCHTVTVTVKICELSNPC